MTLRCFGIWRAMCACVVVLAFTAAAMWVPQALQGNRWWVSITLAWLAVASAAVFIHAWRLRPMSLRWDTQRWHVGSLESVGHEPRAGRIDVALDAGPWMLLHFVADEASVLRRGIWLPAQRRGHETAWHALRCAVYCARPAALPTAAPF